jgi:hypothetical protein
MNHLTKLITLLSPLRSSPRLANTARDFVPLHAGLTYPLAPNPIIKAKMLLVLAEVVDWYPHQDILLRRPRLKCIANQ